MQIQLHIHQSRSNARYRLLVAGILLLTLIASLAVGLMAGGASVINLDHPVFRPGGLANIDGGVVFDIGFGTIMLICAAILTLCFGALTYLWGRTSADESLRRENAYLSQAVANARDSLSTKAVMYTMAHEELAEVRSAYARVISEMARNHNTELDQAAADREELLSIIDRLSSELIRSRQLGEMSTGNNEVLIFVNESLRDHVDELELLPVFFYQDRQALLAIIGRLYDELEARNTTQISRGSLLESLRKQ